MFGKPIPIWIIFGVLSYGVFASTAELAHPSQGHATLRNIDIGFVLLDIITAMWLVYAVWTYKAYVASLAWFNWVIFAVGVVIGMLNFSPSTVPETGTQTPLITVWVVMMIVTGLYALIPIYLTRWSRKTGTN